MIEVMSVCIPELSLYDYTRGDGDARRAFFTRFVLKLTRITGRSSSLSADGCHRGYATSGQASRTVTQPR